MITKRVTFELQFDLDRFLKDNELDVVTLDPNYNKTFVEVLREVLIGHIGDDYTEITNIEVTDI